MPNLYVVGRISTRSDSSPRRYFTEILTNQPSYGVEQFVSEDINQLIKTSSLKELLARPEARSLARINGQNRHVFATMLTEQIAWGRSVVPPDKEGRFVQELMMWLGFEKTDYAVTKDGTLQITGWDNISQRLEAYRKRRSGQ
jgi:hypothetical protein